MRAHPTSIRPSARVLLVACLAATAACGSDRTLAPILPPAEAELLATTLVDVTFDALFRGIGDAVATEPTEDGERVLAVTVDCEGGGEAAVMGVVTGTVEPGATYDVEIEADLELRSCRRGEAVLDRVATAPPLALEADLAAVNGERVGDQVVDVSGRVAWTAEAGGAALECLVELAAAHDPLGRTRVLQGVACGREVETSHTLED